MKQAVVDTPPQYVKAVDFGVLSPQNMLKQSVVEMCERDLYDLDHNHAMKAHGPLDLRLGVSDRDSLCKSCDGTLATCKGHFGHVQLALPVFHIGYFKHCITILQNICKTCSKVLLTETDKRAFLKELRRPFTDNLRRMQLLKKINDQCRKQRICEHCGSVNGVVKKVAPLKAIHDKFRYVGKKVPEEKLEFDRSFRAAREAVADVEKHHKRAMDDLNALKVLHLFLRVENSELELLGMDATKGRPENYLWRYMPVPPVSIRPSVKQESDSNEDDLTIKLSEIVNLNCIIRSRLEKGESLLALMTAWEELHASIALYINADTPVVMGGGPGQTSSSSKPIRALCQRLKGKTGRFRGNLSGKRVNFSGRTVISPDPNLRIDEVAVPELVAKTLTYPERVTRYNIEKLRDLVRRGMSVHPGANYVIKQPESRSISLKFVRDRDSVARNLQIGDVVERHLEDGDVVLFNRQPSLHRLSILSHFAKIRPWRTFRLNECVCTPFNADFDGDEMNLHVPQTEEARAEAMALMGVKNNLVTPKSGEPIIAATQDFITGSYLISNKDHFLTRTQFCMILAMMSDAVTTFDLPPPTIVKPVKLWTGKQVFSMLIRPNHQSRVIINLESKNKTFHPPVNKSHAPEMSPNDGYLLIRGSEVLAGSMDKATLGDGKKNSVFYAILRDYGPDEAATAMNRMAKMCARWLGNRGFSIGISDVTPGEQLSAQKDRLVELAYQKCEDLIEQLKQGKLELQPGCNEEQTLEAKISGILSKVREEVGDVCIRELDKSNAPLIMANCGSKGSNLNVSQMVAVVGQQIISGTRVPDGFQDRSLPHFRKFSKSPPSKGFVRNSFFSGLTPPEFLFHAISGREGLVDTAVKTAETGYMSRRLVKSLEDLSTQYDDTVRTAVNGVVQFKYGGDGLDPFDMEADAMPVNFDKTWEHARNLRFSNEERGLLPYEVVVKANGVLGGLESKLLRRDNLGKVLDETIDTSAEAAEILVDEHDPQRDFYQSLRTFIHTKAHLLAQVRRRKNMQPLLDPPEGHDDIDFDELVPLYKRKAVDRIYKITDSMLDEFLDQCVRKYDRAHVEPGTAVGVIGAQSIGEPGTQMTLKTFHFAGVASMNVTLGVPRIKEIINGSKSISTPIIRAILMNDDDERVARMIKGRIEKTQLKDVAAYIEDVHTEFGSFVAFQIDWRTIENLRLELTMNDFVRALVAAPKLKISEKNVQIVGHSRIEVAVELPKTAAKAPGSRTVEVESETELYFRSQQLRRALPEVVIKGWPNISRAVINIREKDNKKELLVEGYGLREVMTTDGVVGTSTTTNHIWEAKEVLGIEAARACIIQEIQHTMGSHGMSVDPRHIQLLGDVMTYKGDLLGVTRFGMAKKEDSVLQLASFEKTTDHLFDAAFYMKTSPVIGVTECIILGQKNSLGTGAFEVVKPLSGHRRIERKALFEDAWL